MHSSLLLMSFIMYLASFARGYVIHKSCDYMENTLRMAIENAFEMARGISTQLTKYPVDPYIKEIAQYMLSSEEESWRYPLVKVAQVLRLEKKRDYDAFLKDPKAWPLEVVIFCDFKHLEPITFSDATTQKEVTGRRDPWYFYNNDDSLYSECNTGRQEQVISYTNIQEIEYVEKAYPFDSPKKGSVLTKPNIIHLCEWYLRRLTDNKGGFHRSADVVARIPKGPIDTALYGGNKTHADLIAGLDHLFLQEFTNAISLERSWKKYLERNAQEPGSKGWLDASGKGKSGNAYSIAFTGLAIDIILRSNYTITAMGRIVPKSRFSDVAVVLPRTSGMNGTRRYLNESRQAAGGG